MPSLIPVITIDGTSGCGKGTLAHRLARELGWHYLDSGALYRIVAWACLQDNFLADDTELTTQFVAKLAIEFKDNDNAEAGFNAFCNGVDVSDLIRTPQCSQMASKVSAIPAVRAALMQQQLDFRQLPGLVTDGRDMGTVVFPDAPCKLYLTASLEERAHRRYSQLMSAGVDVSIESVQQDLAERDQRDMSRNSAPLKPADDAVVIDTSSLSIDDVYRQSLSLVPGITNSPQ